MAWNKRRKHIGIYQITIDDYLYIGKSVDIFMRWSKHMTDLFAETHHNKNLQKIFLESNYKNMTFTILKLCKKSEVNKLEKQFIKDNSSDKLLNIALKKKNK